jgi:hypothetical protein
MKAPPVMLKKVQEEVWVQIGGKRLFLGTKEHTLLASTGKPITMRDPKTGKPVEESK